MSKLPDHSEQCINLQGMCDFFPRLHALLSEHQLNILANETQIKANTLAQYKAGNTYPSLPRLAVIAQHCNTSLQWLLFGEQNTTHEKISSPAIQLITMTDDTMYPTIHDNATVQYQSIPLTKSGLLNDGICVITTKRGNIVRRIQWQEETESYRVFCDNANYPSQIMKNVNVIGKVTAVMTAI